MELTEYLFVNFIVLNITMTSCIISKLYILCIHVHGKRLIFIFIAIVLHCGSQPPYTVSSWILAA